MLVIVLVEIFWVVRMRLCSLLFEMVLIRFLVIRVFVLFFSGRFGCDIWFMVMVNRVCLFCCGVSFVLLMVLIR